MVKKELSLEELWEIDRAIEEMVRVNPEIMAAIRERVEDSGLPKENFAEAFASNLKFKVANFIKGYWTIKKEEENRLDEIIINRLKERAAELI